MSEDVSMQAVRRVYGSEFRVDAPGVGPEYGVVKINIPVPWAMLRDADLDPDALAREFTPEMQSAFVAWVRFMARKERSLGSRLLEGQDL